jgi:hypothetical protein
MNSGKRANTDAALYGFEDRVHVVDAQNRRTLLLSLLAESQKPIQIWVRKPRVLAIDDEGMAVQVLRCLGHAAAPDIRGGGVDVDVHRHQVPLNEIGLARRHHANGDVGLAHAEVQFALIEHQLDRHFRMKIQELLHPRRKPGRAQSNL